MVDELKRKAGEQSVLLAEKQAEADTALREITISMQVCSSLQWWIQDVRGFQGLEPPPLFNLFKMFVEFIHEKD